MEKRKVSLVELIQHFFTQIKDPKILSSSKHKVLFIFDGLDECRLPLDFRSNPRCCDVTEPASVDVLLTNLIKGNLLPSALLWITTRPAAAGQIPPECVDQVTEIRGFSDPQKEEYFKKRIRDKNLASRTIIHLKSSRSLFIMCHIPVFCWILATVVEVTSEKSERREMPRTLTRMYTHFLIIQTCIKKEKYTERKETDEEMIFKLAKLAFQQLEKGNLIFYEEDLRECGIDVTEASVYSGVCTQIFREDAGLCHGRVFSFVHLSIQEFLAALYVFLCFSNRENMPEQQQTSQLSALFRAATLHDLHKTAVDLALQSKNGHLDLFLRFLLGLSLESNQNLLRCLLPQTSSQSQSSEQTVQYVKQEIRLQMNSDRKINLFYCLNELNQHAVVKHIDRSSGALSVVMLLPGQWRTREFKFKLSEEQLDGFDLQKYIKTPEEDLTELLSPDDILQKLVPAVTSALLEDCSLTEKSCAALASAARSTSCSLKELNLSDNQLHDAGVQHLSDLLKDPQCKLETLVLIQCSLTKKSCAALASAARSTSCSLKELNLSDNQLHDAGVQHLSDLLKDTQCKLETLVLERCSLTEKSCAALASAARSTSCSLKELDLSGNQLHDAGVQHLSDLLKDPQCKLETLVVDQGIFRKESPAAAAAASTSSSPSSDAAEHTHKEDHCSDDTQRGCESCAEVPDSSHWVLVEPEVSTEKSVSTYSLSSSAGSYECSVSGLRWSCAGPVTLQYRFMDCQIFSEELVHMQYSPAGPLMDIKLVSGELEEIHLPHFLCLGGSQSSLKDAVKVLHKQDSGVCLETCELSRSHARLVNPSLSILGVVFKSLMSFLLPGNEKEDKIKIHTYVHVYRSSILPLTFHVYLMPMNDHLKKLVEEQEESEDCRGVLLKKPRPVRRLQLHEFYTLQADCDSSVLPGELELSDDDTVIPNYSIVRIGKAGDFKITLLNSVRKEVWQAEVLGIQCWPPHQGTTHTSIQGPVSSFPCGVEPAHTQTPVDQQVGCQEVQTPECSSRLQQSGTRAQRLDLFSTLDELRCKELKRFKAYLSEETMEGFKPIPPGLLEQCDATEVASKMRQAYGKEGAWKVTVAILEKMNLNDLAGRLERGSEGSSGAKHFLLVTQAADFMGAESIISGEDRGTIRLAHGHQDKMRGACVATGGLYV
ncbi:hypothetical protein ACEWY4_026444 [Coilia grayii]|uniref:Uncharacterized protein n=1 Tax=Coilia grayii TaxID=363190 RepID=A0ABD1IVV5_9TELE